ncbi:MAG: AAA family ATPase [Succinivibrionaceae bacterium]|nr:AAA family ATPase [Succinivibrionaceae bacterium]
MGRYPVISISFKDVDGKNYQDAVNRIIAVFAKLAEKFDFLTRRDELDTLFLKQIRDLNAGKIPVFRSDGNFDGTNINLILDFLSNLALCLKKTFDKPAVVIIDEYDVPLHKAQVNGYYDDLLRVIREILGVALKDNSENIFKGFITGCLGISHQGIFTGFNNYMTFGIQDRFLSGFIGFTREETENLLKQSGMENRIHDVLEWYDGYNFAGNDMLCPWSVLNFMVYALSSRDPATFQPQNYWANSSGNDIIELCMKNPGRKETECIQSLLDGKNEQITLREFTSYPSISSHTDFNNFATLMLHTGYLTVAKDSNPSETKRVSVRIPNREILECFSDKAEIIFSGSNPQWLEKAVILRDALLNGDCEQAQNIMNNMLRKFISVRDPGHEYYYHMFLSGVLSITSDDDLDVKSQIEQGDGYPDIIIDNLMRREAVILELKKADGREISKLKSAAGTALEQIRNKNYDREFKEREYRRIIRFGVSFYGKECLVLKMPDASISG